MIIDRVDLEDFLWFLEWAGYLDSDWRDEKPTAIERYEAMTIEEYAKKVRTNDKPRN